MVLLHRTSTCRSRRWDALASAEWTFPLIPSQAHGSRAGDSKSATRVQQEGNKISTRVQQECNNRDCA